MKIVSIVGARPEFIQAARMSQAIRTRHQEVLVHTGQHYDYEMSDVFFEQLGLPKPDHNLGVGSGSHAWQTGEILSRLERVLLCEKPDWVIVRGDTNSTLAAALAAAKLCFPLAHVEAGLRSFNSAMPEEINRVATDHISDILFCPTQAAMDNLQREGLAERANLVGDVMYELILLSAKLANERSDVLERLGLRPHGYLLVTVHRVENTDNLERLTGIVEGLNSLTEHVVFPVHPRTRAALQQHDIALGANIQAIPPVSYLDMVQLQKEARLVLTDSGGMQKEAYCLNTPCLTLREQTEWVETVDAGWNILVGTDPLSIKKAVKQFQPPVSHPNLYGDGKTSTQIVVALETYSEVT